MRYFSYSCGFADDAHVPSSFLAQFHSQPARGMREQAQCYSSTTTWCAVTFAEFQIDSLIKNEENPEKAVLLCTHVLPVIGEKQPSFLSCLTNPPPTLPSCLCLTHPAAILFHAFAKRSKTLEAKGEF